eukprot:scaffold670846_cov66-Prasinocladus_malaysianus.AAC.1
MAKRGQEKVEGVALDTACLSFALRLGKSYKVRTCDVLPVPQLFHTSVQLHNANRYMLTWFLCLSRFHAFPCSDYAYPQTNWFKLA